MELAEMLLLQHPGQGEDNAARHRLCHGPYHRSAPAVGRHPGRDLSRRCRMIARVKHPLGTMYMPLWRLDSGKWIPIGPLAATVRDAKRICNRRMRDANAHIEGV